MVTKAFSSNPWTIDFSLAISNLVITTYTTLVDAPLYAPFPSNKVTPLPNLSIKASVISLCLSDIIKTALA
jgi:hypothetical protein